MISVPKRRTRIVLTFEMLEQRREKTRALKQELPTGRTRLV